MPRKLSAGLLLYRRAAGRIEVLLVHPAGNYNRHKPWSIPKGELDTGEEPQHAARRETREETGIDFRADLVSLGTVSYTRSRKDIHCFTGQANADALPRIASPEVDRAEFLPLSEARRLLHPEQCPLLDRLLAHLEGTSATSAAGPLEW
jgi:predicted NUDIX family NTP pyrophosphohydrolase